MADEKSKRTLQTPLPILDKSKWAKVDKAKPVDPRDVIQAALAIRPNPELWAIFEALKPDDWISEEDGARISIFYRQHFEKIGRGGNVSLRGQEKILLRCLREGQLKNFDSDDELMAFLKLKNPSGI